MSTLSNTKNEKLAGAGEHESVLDTGYSLYKADLGMIGAALLEHVKKYPDVFKVIEDPKLPQRDDL
jgi:hypothetical protein